MSQRTIDRLIQLLPGYQAAQKALHDETLGSRAALIGRIREKREHADGAEAKLVAEAAALNRKAAKLRHELAEVESKLEANLNARGSLRFCVDADIRELQSQLRSEVVQKIRAFQLTIERTRERLHTNEGNARGWILSADCEKPYSDARVVAALALLLEVHRGLDEIAVGHADVDAAIAESRARITAANIQLVEPSTLLH